MLDRIGGERQGEEPVADLSAEALPAGVADRGAVEARLGSEATVHPQAQDHRAALASLDREHAL